ncbi:unnamed protein product [Urochloa humidicola]
MARADDPSCTFSHCFCRWHTPPTPRVSPGRDYAFIPADDDGAAWSLLVGVVSKFDAGSSLRLHQLGVARSGRVLGRSGGALEVLADDVEYKPRNTWPRFRAAAAAADGRSLSLCLFSRELDLADSGNAQPPRAVELHIDLAGGGAAAARVAVSPLPALPLDPLMPTFPIAAAGELWAPHLTSLDAPSRLVMQRLDRRDAAGGRWVEAAGVDLPESSYTPVFQGYAVVGGRTILLSLQSNLFFAFDCSTLDWEAVSIDEARWGHYVPFQWRSVYVEEDDAIYFLSDGGSV